MARSLRLIELAIAGAFALSGAALAADAPAASSTAPAASSAAAACPAPGAADAPVALIAKPRWVHRPDSSDMDRFYPSFQCKSQKSDEILMDCAVADDGKLQSCQILKDQRPGAGFDKASLSLAKTYQMVPLSEIADYTALPECIRKAGPPHIVMPLMWRPGNCGR